MNKKIITIATAIIMMLSCGALAACKPPVENLSKEIKMPTDKLTYALDDSIAISTAKEFSANQYVNNDSTDQNANRGFRLETYYTLGSGQAWPGDGINGYDYLNDMLAFYSEVKVNEIQVYIYLTEYKAKDLDSFALGQLEEYFKYISSKNMTMALRFAYEPDQNGKNAPTQRQMLKNIAILKTWINNNINLWYSTVTIHQIGHIGAWGEFGSSKQNYNRKKIVNAVCDMTPENTYIQGRYIDVTKLADKKYAHRVGYHNDFLIGRPHPWNTAGGDNQSEKYKIFEQTNKYRINDGEMPWAGGTEEPNEYVDGNNLIKQLYEHHMTSLSLEHNYREFIKGGKHPKEYYNIQRYKNEYLTLQEVKDLGLPYYSQYFMTAEGKSISRSKFDYIQDFLGYRLVLSNLNMQNIGGNTTVRLMITNFGFGAPLNIGKAELVYFTAKGEFSIPLTGFDKNTLTTYGQNIVSASLPGGISPIRIGIRFTTHGGHNIATANGTATSPYYKDGINIIKH